MTTDPLAPVPLLTAHQPGIGGRIKERPEDFEVEEVPAYEPSGAGDHLYLWVEKCGLGAEYFARQLAARLAVSRGDIGAAGLKDRHAVTRQWVSVPASAEERVGQLDGDGIRVLKVSRHTNKLKPGHLHGNRFRVLIRGVEPGCRAALDRIIGLLREQGLPNYYGRQRFGHGGETASMGFALLRGGTAAGAVRRNPFLRKLALSAAQSALFNTYLARRLNDGLFRQVMLGDVMGKWPAGGLFRVEDVAAEQARFDRRETVPTGPIFGRKMFPAAGAATAREAAILAEAELTTDSFAGFAKLLQGTRRHNLVYLDDLAADWESEGVRLTFTLPAGSYATVLLQEMMKTPACDAEGGETDSSE